MTMYNVPKVLCPMSYVLCPSPMPDQIVRRAKEKVVRACVSMRVMLVFCCSLVFLNMLVVELS